MGDIRGWRNSGHGLIGFLNRKAGAFDSPITSKNRQHIFDHSGIKTAKEVKGLWQSLASWREQFDKLSDEKATAAAARLRSKIVEGATADQTSQKNGNVRYWVNSNALNEFLVGEAGSS